MTATTLQADCRVVLTLDAGGTSFRFSAMRGGVAVTETTVLPSDGDNLERCLTNVVEGFAHVKAKCPTPPVAISFAFPGPADYPNGIIGDLVNLPGFRNGVALGPMLEDRFKIPVFINNDGDLFAYGEAIAGLLPHVNGLLNKVGSPKRYSNLLGVTLGTGFGGGIVRNGELFVGDNSGAGEICLLRNKYAPRMNVEEGACIRALRRDYGVGAGIAFDDTPDPQTIARIAINEMPGDAAAAREAYRRMGQVVGDALGDALTLLDGLVVIGGGISKSWRLFLPAAMQELNEVFIAPNGNESRRLRPAIYCLEDPAQLKCFLNVASREIIVPRSERKIRYDATPRLAVGITRLGTSEAIALGAYAFALRALEKR